jgi:hypothetical protein
MCWALLCALGWMGVTPSTAWAAPSIPMCSVFGECAEAPLPEAPPTGGEVRAQPRNPFDLGPRLDLAPNQDNVPLDWQLRALEPLSLSDADPWCPWIETAEKSFCATLGTRASSGVAPEVFRPPCTRHRARGV